jgi:hypothetical protein
MSLSLPGAPGISMARRSLRRQPRFRSAAEARSRRRAAEPRPPAPVAPAGTPRLHDLADALHRIQAATGLDGRQVATRLVEPLDAASPLRALDVFAAGRADLVAAYLQGAFDGPGLLTAWQRG